MQGKTKCIFYSAWEKFFLFVFIFLILPCFNYYYKKNLFTSSQQHLTHFQLVEWAVTYIALWGVGERKKKYSKFWKDLFCICNYHMHLTCIMNGIKLYSYNYSEILCGITLQFSQKRGQGVRPLWFSAVHNNVLNPCFYPLKQVAQWPRL